MCAAFLGIIDEWIFFVHQVHKILLSITGACDSFGNHRCVQNIW